MQYLSLSTHFKDGAYSLDDKHVLASEENLHYVGGFRYEQLLMSFEIIYSRKKQLKDGN